jgi:[ribosomal protein S18]-alanine N-acetyltransferase
MAVLQRIREFFILPQENSEVIIPAPPSTYRIQTLTINHLKEVWKLNQRCFKNGENYPRYTLSYLLTESNTLSYSIISANNEMVGFIFITVQDGTGHITTIGVAPEHRRRGLARQMLKVAEDKLRLRGIATICLEVRVSNSSAQSLYRELDYAVMQRLVKYYSNGEDGFLMVKPLILN